MSAGQTLVSIDEIEQEIEQLKLEGAQSEAWIAYRSRLQSEQIEERESLIRAAFEAGRMRGENEHKWGYFSMGFVGGMLSASIVFVILNSL